MKALASARTAPALLSARLWRVDVSLALEMQAWLDATPADPVPDKFKSGRAAPCFALLNIAHGKPSIFWSALVAFALLPVLLARSWF
ncbi:hypothetical protein [Cupriavidus sp. AU9028]|uniref:hypothetical protein n=1 Tax=Cupriavidus sp. AU9028 TaxID=2871157 RepID=UPI002102F1B4|nr:hypothetical protein [Cupriavidus sp. AU9028]